MDAWRVCRRGEGWRSVWPRRVDMKAARTASRQCSILKDNGGKPERQQGSISFPITGDEEDTGQRHDKTAAMVAAREGSTIACSASPAGSRCYRRLHRVGRRGSLSGTLQRKDGRAVSLPHRARTPCRIFAADRGDSRPLDRGSAQFNQPRIHLGRRQHRKQRHPQPGARQIQHPLRSAHPSRRDLVDARLARPAAAASRPASSGAQSERVRHQTRAVHRSGGGDRGSDGRSRTVDAAAPRMHASSPAIVR